MIINNAYFLLQEYNPAFIAVFVADMLININSILDAEKMVVAISIQHKEKVLYEVLFKKNAGKRICLAHETIRICSWFVVLWSDSGCRMPSL